MLILILLISILLLHYSIYSPDLFHTVHFYSSLHSYSLFTTYFYSILFYASNFHFVYNICNIFGMFHTVLINVFNAIKFSSIYYSMLLYFDSTLVHVLFSKNSCDSIFLFYSMLRSCSSLPLINTPLCSFLFSWILSFRLDCITAISADVLQLRTLWFLFSLLEIKKCSCA